MQLTLPPPLLSSLDVASVCMLSRVCNSWREAADAEIHQRTLDLSQGQEPVPIPVKHMGRHVP